MSRWDDSRHSGDRDRDRGRERGSGSEDRSRREPERERDRDRERGRRDDEHRSRDEGRSAPRDRGSERGDRDRDPRDERNEERQSGRGPGGGSCYKCGESGHFARECPQGGGSSGGSGGGGNCYKCGEPGHFSRECPSGGGGGGGSGGGGGNCYKCGEPGHFSRECPQGGGGGGRKRRGAADDENESMYDWGKKDNAEDEEGGAEGGDGEKPKVKKVKPNMERSGKLQEEALKTDSGVVLKFVDPPEAKRPSRKWRLYPFKGDQALEVIPVHHQASYLFGRDRAVSAIPTDHISCSKQHAALVHRQINIKDELGIGPGKMVNKPYIIDLESANGTFLNGKRIDASRFYELKPKDVIKFAQSSREYVLLHDELAKS